MWPLVRSERLLLSAPASYATYARDRCDSPGRQDPGDAPRRRRSRRVAGAMDQDDGKAGGADRPPAAKGNWRAPAGLKRWQIAEVDFFERIVHRCKLRRRVFGAERDRAAKDCDKDRNQTPSENKKYVHRQHSLHRALLHPRRLSLQGGHSRPGRASSKSGHVCFAAKSGSKFRALATSPHRH